MHYNWTLSRGYCDSRKRFSALTGRHERHSGLAGGRCSAFDLKQCEGIGDSNVRADFVCRDLTKVGCHSSLSPSRTLGTNGRIDPFLGCFRISLLTEKFNSDIAHDLYPTAIDFARELRTTRETISSISKDFAIAERALKSSMIPFILHCGIQQLPSELLTKIFEYAVSIEPGLQVKLSHVSRGFREICLASHACGPNSLAFNLRTQSLATWNVAGKLASWPIY